MLNHFSITATNLDAAVWFYDAIMTALGHQQTGRLEDQVTYGQRPSDADPYATYFSVKQVERVPLDPRRHWCFVAHSREQVDQFWQAGIAAGGKDEGGPGLRPEYAPTYYAAFLADPDGNRIEAVCHKAVHAVEN